MEQQKVSFEMLYLKVQEGVLYLTEDTHSSYWKEFDGGFKNSNSFIEYSKKMIDSLYSEHINPKIPVLVN